MLTYKEYDPRAKLAVALLNELFSTDPSRTVIRLNRMRKQAAEMSKKEGKLATTREFRGSFDLVHHFQAHV